MNEPKKPVPAQAGNIVQPESSVEAIRTFLETHATKPVSAVSATLMVAIEGLKARKSKDSFVIGTNKQCLGIQEWPTNHWIPVKNDAGEMLFGSKKNLTFGLSNMSLATTAFWTEVHGYVGKLEKVLNNGMIHGKTQQITADLFNGKKKRVEFLPIVQKVLGDLFAADKPLDTKEKRELYTEAAQKAREEALKLIKMPSYGFATKQELIKHLEKRGDKVDMVASKAQ